MSTVENSVRCSLQLLWLVDSMAAGSDFPNRPCRHIIGVPLLPSGTSPYASVRSAHVKKTYSDSIRNSTNRLRVVHTCAGVAS